MSDKIKGWAVKETIGISNINQKSVCSFPITDELWAIIEERAAADGMDPIEWFNLQIAKANASEKLQEE